MEKGTVCREYFKKVDDSFFDTYSGSEPVSLVDFANGLPHDDAMKIKFVQYFAFGFAYDDWIEPLKYEFKAEDMIEMYKSWRPYKMTTREVL